MLDDCLVRLVEQERLAALRVDVCVGAEEGAKGTDLVPPREHLWAWVAEEAADVGWGERPRQ